MTIPIPPEIWKRWAGRRLTTLIELVEARRELPQEPFADGSGFQIRERVCEHFNAALRRTVLDRPEEPILSVEWGSATDELASAWLTLESGDRLALLARGGREGHDGFTFPAIERIPADVAVRPAVTDDGPALREIERTTPMDFETGAVTYDKGDDYFAQDRMKEHESTFVIEIDRKPAGLFKIAERWLNVAGEVRHFIYAHRHRVAPWAQGRGLHNLINFLTFAAQPKNAIRYDLIRSDHRLTRSSSPDSFWSVSPERVLIDTRAHADSGPPAGRPAMPTDAATLVDLLNDTHGAKALYVPYTERTLAMRLSRLPHGYAWNQIRVGDRAALGTWPADWIVTHMVGDQEVIDRRAIVLDYGMREGAEAELIDLIRAECNELASRGITEISLFTTPGDRGRDALLGLARTVEPYRLIMPLPEPPNLLAHGIYLDQVYL